MFLGLVFWQWFLVAAGCFVVAAIALTLGYLCEHKNIAWLLFSQVIAVICSFCMSISGFIGIVLLVMTIVKSFF